MMIKPRWSGYVGVLYVALLAGCVSSQAMPPPAPAPLPPPQPPQPPQVAQLPLSSAADDVMEMLGRFGGASPAELAREYDALAAIPEPNRGGASQLRLALLLAQPGLPFRDDAAALRVLQEWERRQPAADPALKSFVHWQKSMLTERNRLAAALDESSAKLREEKKRADACKDKLEAIKEMEKSLIERDKR
jgi:hypothetical protein